MFARPVGHLYILFSLQLELKLIECKYSYDDHARKSSLAPPLGMDEELLSWFVSNLIASGHESARVGLFDFHPTVNDSSSGFVLDSTGISSTELHMCLLQHFSGRLFCPIDLKQ